MAMHDWLREDSRRRRLVLATGVYLVATATYFTFAARATLETHTPWNHYALLAEAWLDGRLDLQGGPPDYAGMNDFARYRDQWFVVFPPFPAVLLIPVVALAGNAERVQDGQFFLWLAGIGPAMLFLVFEKLRRLGVGGLDVRQSMLLSVLFAFGTVYFFTAVQGTVWYAAHVVGVALAAAYLLFALDAERPWLAGCALGLGMLSRSPLLLAAPLFLLEAIRVTRLPRPTSASLPETGAPTAAGDARRVDAWVRAARVTWDRTDRPRLLRLWTAFSVPVVVAVAVALLHNQARFDDAFDFGYRHLTVAWQDRMQKWGLFGYHYLARNLGVVLTSLPWVTRSGEPVSFQVNGHGLALWVTSPFYLWLLWPRRTGPVHWALVVTVAAVALPTLLYQNTGWVQFGYRFSNDYAVFLMALLVVGGHRLRGLFWGAAGWAVVLNGFGAVTFNRPAYRDYYHVERTQRVLFQPD